MRTCPNCTQELPGEATRCHRCGRELPPTEPVTDVRYTHSGHRYVLGYGADFFGIWDRQAPGVPAERFPRTDEGWQRAWLRYVGIERHFVEVPAEAGAAAPPPSGVPAPSPSEALSYSHSGHRYVLGYGADFFGIWDRQAPGVPAERFPRTDEGWREAWTRFSQLEPDHVEAGKLGGATPSAGMRAVARPARTVNGAWWLLPIFFGLLGGIVAWLVNRRVEPRIAGWMLAAGAASSVLASLLYLTALPR